MKWFLDYWWWWVGFFWFLGIEAYALIMQYQSRLQDNPDLWRPTLSQLVWRAYRDNPWIQWPVLFLSVGLLIHFFVRRNQEAPVSMLVFGLVMVAAYVVRRFYL